MLTMRRLLLVGIVSLLACVPAATAGDFLGKPSGRWQQELADAQPAVRRSAAFALGRLGAIEAVPDLLTRLQEDRDPGVREMAATAIGDIIKAQRGGDRELWQQAGPALEKAATADSEPRVRRGAVYALGTFGRLAASASETLRKALGDGSSSVRQNAAWALGQLGSDAGAQAVAALCDRLGDADVLVRRDSAGALGAIGASASRSGVPALMSLVKVESDEVVKKTALDALSHLAGPEHRPIAGSLGRLLRDPDVEIARGAALVLAKIGGPEAAGAVPVLRRALADDDTSVQELAAAALANLGPEAEPATTDLARALLHAPSPAVQRNAALALGHIGAPGRDLARTIKTADSQAEREKAEKALAVVERASREAVPALGRSLAPSVPLEVRQFAAEALAQFGYPNNKQAVPAIVATIKRDTDPLVRQRCVWALFNLQDLKSYGADRVLEDVLDETSRDSLLVRYDAARALANVMEAEAPNKVVAVLLDMLENRGLRVFNRTDARVEGAGNEAARARADVQENLGGDARFMAVEALSWLGAKAARNREVVNALRKAAGDRDPELRKKANEALDVLGIKP
jgi:HEAT repeat protein